VRCECGNRETYLDCGVVDEPLLKVLKCDGKCANLKRFGNFINSSSKMVDAKRVYYPPILLKFTHYNLVYLQKLENRLEDFLINSDGGSYDF
jgi:transcriptional repressor NF-X1